MSFADRDRRVPEGKPAERRPSQAVQRVPQLSTVQQRCPPHSVLTFREWSLPSLLRSTLVHLYN